MLSALILLAAQDAKIDFACNATSLRTALTSLSQATGHKLEANGMVADQVVMIQAHDVSLKDLKDRIATVVAGTWETKGDREIIQRLARQSDAIVADYRAKRKKLLAAEQDRFRKLIEKPFQAKALLQGLTNLGDEPKPGGDRADSIAYWEKQQVLFESGPLARLLRRLFLAASLDDLAAVGPYERHIFTPSPTKRQKGISRAKFDAAISKYREEQSAWVETCRGVDFAEDPRGRMVSDPRTQLKHDPNATEFQFIYTRGEMTGLGMINLRGANDPNSGGRYIIAQANLAGPERDLMNASMKPESVPADDPVIQLSADSKLMDKAFMGMMATRKNVALSPEILALVLNPELKDPLGLSVSDALRDYAKSKKSNFVGCLPDSLFNWMFFASSRRAARLGIVMDTFRRTGALEFEEKDGWIVATPGYRYEDELNFTPRKAMGDLVRSTAKRGTMDTIDFASFAFQSNRISRRGLESLYLGILDTSSLSLMDRNDWNTFRLYGGLSSEQRKIIEENGSVPTRGMSSHLQAIVDRIVYSDEVRSETTASGGSYSTSSHIIEPTEVYANGLPVGAALTGKASASAILVAYGTGPNGKPRGLRSLDPYNLANVETNVVGNPELMKSYGVPDLLGYAPGLQKNIRLRLLLEPGIWRESMISVNVFDDSATPVAWDKLPEEWVKQIKAGFEQVKAQNEREKKGTPPPNR